MEQPQDGHGAMDEGRRRRRERLAARRDVRPPPRVEPSQGRALRARAAATDRTRRFEERLDRVRADAVRRERRRVQLDHLVDAGMAVTGLVAGLVASLWLSATVAVGIGVGVALVLLAGRRVAAALAVRRGAEAWDWQAGRHRLLGRPAARVQQADAPPPTDPRR